MLLLAIDNHAAIQSEWQRWQGRLSAIDIAGTQLRTVVSAPNYALNLEVNRFADCSLAHTHVYRSKSYDLADK
jgi:hypothetical protein